MNIVILTANFGNGHKSVANSIREQFEGENVVVHVLDPRTYQCDQYITDKVNEYVYNNVISKYPRNFILSNCYHASYKLGSSIPVCRKLVKESASDRTEDVIAGLKPDVVINTYPHYINIPKNYGKYLKIYTVITDFTFETVWYDKQNNGFFVPNIEVRSKLLKKGVNIKDIHMTGIPVKSEFFETNDQTCCKEVLITLGARGQIPKSDMIKILTKLQNYDVNIVVVCGLNEKLFNHICEHISSPKIKVFQYVNNMNELFKKADLVVTKAGGISVSEAIASEKPMIINKSQSLKGQELANIKFIKKNQLGFVCSSDKIVNAIVNLIEDEDQYVYIKNNIANIKYQCYQKSIKEIVLERNNEV